MGTPKISLLEINPKVMYECHRCKKVTKKNKFLWTDWSGKEQVTICRECAYKESFGTNNIKKAKKDRVLEEKEINQT